MNKKTAISICVAMLASFVSSSFLKVYVKNFALKVEATEIYTEQLKHEIRVLHAEVTHLSNNDRIGRIAKVHLKMDKVKASQIAYLSDAQGSIMKGGEDLSRNNRLLVQVGWRYKSRDQILKTR